jgi:uncharacterized membrane protein YbhN (UPF0104 family)
LETIRNVDAPLWLSSFAIFLIGHVVSALKWRLLAAPSVSVPVTFRAHFAGLAANLCLPGVAGGDVVRAALMFRQAPDKTRLALGSLADRLVDTAGLLLISISAVAFALERALADVHLFAGIGAAIGAAAVSAILAVLVARLMLRRLPQGSRLGRFLEQAQAGAMALAREPGRLALCLALSISVQAAFIGVNIAIAAVGGVHVPIVAWFFAWPLSKIIATLPVSVAGLGVREASLASLLAPFGAAPAPVIATGLIWQSILFAAGLVGGMIVVLSSSARALRDEQETSVKLP